MAYSWRRAAARAGSRNPSMGAGPRDRGSSTRDYRTEQQGALPNQQWLNDTRAHADVMAREGATPDGDWIAPQDAFGHRIDDRHPQVQDLSHFLCQQLRHDAESPWLQAGIDGFVPVQHVMALCVGKYGSNFTLAEIANMVRTSDEFRFQFRAHGDRIVAIRATQGHSIKCIDPRAAYGDPLTADQVRNLKCLSIPCHLCEGNCEHLQVWGFPRRNGPDRAPHGPLHSIGAIRP